MSPWSRRLAVASVAVAAVFVLPTSAQATVTTAPAVAQTAPVAAVNTPVQAPEVAAVAAASASYRVVSGDTLFGIAGRYGTTWPTIWHANDFISNPDLIYPDQVLTIPDASASSAPAPVAPAPAAPAPAPAAASSGWTAPVNACVGSPFGEQRSGYTHQGVDLLASYGTPIHAAAAGTVSVAYQAGGAGNYTMINHGGGVWTVYMHQSSYQVTSGYVSAGQVIGYVGSTGDSTGPHLHFEVHPYGLWNQRVDPVKFMADRGVYLGC